MNVLIIGGTGVLSSAVTKEALRKGIKVTMINRGNREIPEGVEHIKADKDDLSYIAKMLYGRFFDAIMDYLCYTDEETIQSVNFYRQFTKQYFYISSCAVYNTQLANGELMNEDYSKVLPEWRYSVNKWASEQKLVDFFKDSDVHYTIIRPCVTYGDTRIPYGISPRYEYHWTLAARILAGKPIIRWNLGVNRSNITRVEDFAVGVVGLIGNPKAFEEAFNVCGEDTPSFNDVLSTLSECLGKEIITIDVTSDFYAKELPARSGEIKARSIDSINSNRKIKSIVPDFNQTIFLKEGILKTLAAYKSHNYQKGIDWKFDADTDRIIKKWCKRNGIDYKQYKLEFIDYLGSASLSDRMVYWTEKYKDSYIIKLYSITYKTLGSVKRFAMSIFRQR